MKLLKGIMHVGILKKIGIFILSICLFLICSAVLYVTKLASMPQKLPETEGNIAGITNANLEEVTEKKMDDYWTIAIFGVDSRNGEIGAGTNADTQMVMTVNRADGAIRLVSVYRDTFLIRNTETNSFGKINSAYAEGGPVQNVMALNTNLDLKITDYITFSWKAAVDAINMLGGIDLEITDAEWYFINAFITETVNCTGVASSHLSGPGMQHLDGVQAVAYSRLRLSDTDMKRTERQRKVIELVLEKAHQSGWEELMGVMSVVLPQTATSLQFDDLAMMAKNITEYKIVETGGFPFDQEEASLGAHGACLIPNTLESNVTRLHRLLYQDEDYQCSDKVKEIGKEILKQAVRN